jgi:hypothetical protein
MVDKILWCCDECDRAWEEEKSFKGDYHRCPFCNIDAKSVNLKGWCDVNIFVAAICRDKAEGGDGTKYFGSTMSWYNYECQAKDLDLLDVEGNLTSNGKQLGEALANLPLGRAYMHREKYEQIIAEFEKAVVKD